MNVDVITNCAHCGNESSTKFCCTGCEVVFKLLSSHELSPFYKLQNGKTKPVKIVAASLYEYLDRKATYLEYAKTIDEFYAFDFVLEGIHCLGCHYLLENLHLLNPGIKSSTFTLENNLLKILLYPNVKLSEIAALIETLGYKPHLVKETKEIQKLTDRKRKIALMRIGVAAAVSGNIMLLSIAVYAGASPEWQSYFDLLSAIIAIPAITFAAYPFYESSYQALKQRRISIDLPISLAIIVGSIVSYFAVFNHSSSVYFDSITGLIFLLLSSRFIQKIIENRALYHFKKNAHFNVDFVHRLNQSTNQFEQIHFEELKLRDTILVKESTMIPCDGKLLTLSANVDESLLTGESSPRQIQTGETLYQGTLNCGLTFRMEVTALGEETRLNQIISELKYYADQHSLVTISDKIGTYFLTTVMGISLLLLLYFGFKQELSLGIQRVLTLWIVTCPCALAIGTPLSFSLAFQKLFKRGIILKDMKVLEKILLVKSIFLDKTGTLTKSSFKVKNIKICNTITEESKKFYFSIIYALEHNSNHPVAKTLKHYFEEYNNPLIELASYLEVPGVGVKGEYQNNCYEIKQNKMVNENKDGGVTLLENGKELITIYLIDELKSDIAAAVYRLKHLGFPLTIISGDCEIAVERVAKELNIKYKSQLGPEAKAELIKKEPFSVMVGDGGNDALALKSSFLPMTIKGSLPMSMKVSEVYLANDDLYSIITLYETACETKKLIYRNLALSLVYNLLAAYLAIVGLIGPMLAAIFMPLSSLTIILSNLWGTKKLRNLDEIKA